MLNLYWTGLKLVSLVDIFIFYNTDRVLVDKIDSDNDHKVTEHEMVAWIKYIQRRYVSEDAKRQWESYSMKNGDSMTWEYYSNRTYGSLTGNIKFELTMDKLEWCPLIQWEGNYSTGFANLC